MPAFVVALAFLLVQPAPTPPAPAPSIWGPHLEQAGYLGGLDALAVFQQRMFGGGTFEQGRIDVQRVEGTDTFVGWNLASQCFQLNALEIAPIPGVTGGQVWLVSGFAESPLSGGALPTIGVVATMNGDSRFVPLAVFTSIYGYDAMLAWVSALEPQVNSCALALLDPVAAQFIAPSQGVAQNCNGAINIDTGTNIGFCLVGGGILCLFPPTSALGCPGMVVCQAHNLFCSLNRKLKLVNEWSNLKDCVCLAVQAGTNNFAGCVPVTACPSCPIALLK